MRNEKRNGLKNLENENLNSNEVNERELEGINGGGAFSCSDASISDFRDVCKCDLCKKRYLVMDYEYRVIRESSDYFASYDSAISRISSGNTIRFIGQLDEYLVCYNCFVQRNKNVRAIFNELSGIMGYCESSGAPLNIGVMKH